MKKNNKLSRSSTKGSGGKASQSESGTSGGGSTFFKEKAANAMIEGDHPSKVAKKELKTKTGVSNEQEVAAKLKTKVKNSKKREKFGKSNIKKRST